MLRQERQSSGTDEKLAQMVLRSGNGWDRAVPTVLKRMARENVPAANVYGANQHEGLRATKSFLIL
jgi:hypothetical protein